MASVTPPTAPVTTLTPEMSDLLTAIVSSTVISTLRTGRGWLPPAGVGYDAYPGPGKTDQYIYASYGDLPLGTDLSAYALDEGVTPAAEAFASDVNDFSTVEYARVITYTDEQVRTNPHGWLGIVGDKISNAALDLIDAKAGTIWGGYAAAGVPVFTPGTTPAATNPIDTPAIVKAVTTLDMLGVQRIDGASYGCLIRPDVAATLMLEAGEFGWVDATKYAGPERLMTGEIGQYRGVRFFSLPRIPGKEGATTVVPSFFFGGETLVWADLGSLRVTSAPPEVTNTDVLAQRGAAGFRVRCGGRFVHDVKPGTDEKRLRAVVCESTPTVTVAA